MNVSLSFAGAAPYSSSRLVNGESHSGRTNYEANQSAREESSFWNTSPFVLMGPLIGTAIGEAIGSASNSGDSPDSADPAYFAPSRNVALTTGDDHIASPNTWYLL